MGYGGERGGYDDRSGGRRYDDRDDRGRRFGGRDDRGGGGGGGGYGGDRDRDRDRRRDDGYDRGGSRYGGDRDRDRDYRGDNRGGRPRFGGGGSGGGGSGGGGSEEREKPKFDPDADWRCECGNSNFSWRKSCKRCGAGKSKELREAERAAQGGWLLDGLEDTTNRIFIKGFDAESTSEDDLREVFCGIGIISRVRQKTGYPEDWPFAVKIYRDEQGNKKDEAVITYDDPHAAQSAPEFYNGYEFNGKKLHVSIAQSKPKTDRAPPPPSHHGGGRGGGGDRYGDRGGGGRYGGRGGGGYGDRSRPY